MAGRSLARLPRVARLGSEAFSTIDVIKVADLAGMQQPMLRIRIDQSDADRLDPEVRYAVRVMSGSGVGTSWKRIAGATFGGSDQIDEDTGLPVVRELAVSASALVGRLIRVETDTPRWLSLGLEIDIYDAAAARIAR